MSYCQEVRHQAHSPPLWPVPLSSDTRTIKHLIRPQGGQDIQTLTLQTAHSVEISSGCIALFLLCDTCLIQRTDRIYEAGWPASSRLTQIIFLPYKTRHRPDRRPSCLLLHPPRLTPVLTTQFFSGLTRQTDARDLAGPSSKAGDGKSLPRIVFGPHAVAVTVGCYY